MQMSRPFLLLLGVLCAIPVWAQDSRTYRGLMRIPVELHTAAGARLEKGQYATEVNLSGNRFTLVFLQAGVEKAHVKGKLREGDSSAASASIPLAGTSYMRSTADPIATAQERQYSKTGRAQYEEEVRDWKAMMRVYKSRDGQAAHFEFQEKRGKGAWQTVEFRLLLGGKPGS